MCTPSSNIPDDNCSSNFQGGAQIIDLMILVVDINKGIQTQTAECLVIGQITCDKMIVILNKIDLIPEAKREHQIEKVINLLELEMNLQQACG